jgi:hypothetical protein
MRSSVANADTRSVSAWQLAPALKEVRLLQPASCVAILRNVAGAGSTGLLQRSKQDLFRKLFREILSGQYSQPPLEALNAGG